MPPYSPHQRAGFSPEILLALSKLPERLRRFTTAYLEDPSPTNAAIAAGASAGPTAHREGFRMIRDERVQAVLRLFHQVAATDAIVTQAWILERLRENVERALQRVPVLDSKGLPTGEWRYEGSVANGALGLLAKHKQMLVERKEGDDADHPIHLSVDFGKLKGTGRFLPPPPPTPRGRGGRAGDSTVSPADPPPSGPRGRAGKKRKASPSTSHSSGARRGRSRRRAA